MVSRYPPASPVFQPQSWSRYESETESGRGSYTSWRLRVSVSCEWASGGTPGRPAHILVGRLLVVNHLLVVTVRKGPEMFPAVRQAFRGATLALYDSVGRPMTRELALPSWPANFSASYRVSSLAILTGYPRERLQDMPRNGAPPPPIRRSVCHVLFRFT